MVKTGARAGALVELLARIGLEPASVRPSPPRLATLADEWRDRVIALFHELGGVASKPTLRPGTWDVVCRGDLVVELDEELHFNRYRAVTLRRDWADPLPWRAEYLTLSNDREARCLSAATWGKRWSTPSAEALFGPGDPPGHLEAAGAPRWKQRALYDAMKDASALANPHGLRLVRLATHDVIGGTELGEVLEGRATIDLDALGETIAARST